MHKDTRWAQQIISLQDEDGKWGYFHTLFTDSKSPITTEKALKRLEILGHLSMIFDTKWQNFCVRKNTYANVGISTRFLTDKPAVMISLP